MPDNDWEEIERDTAAIRLLSSYEEAHTASFGLGAPVLTFGQSLESGPGGTLVQVKLLAKTNSPPITGNATAKIWAHTGTFGAGGKPTGSALATSDNFDISELTTDYQLITLRFSGANRILLLPHTNYFLTLTAPDAKLIAVGTVTAGTAPGNGAYYNAAVPGWVAVAYDMPYYLYVLNEWSENQRSDTDDFVPRSRSSDDSWTPSS